MSIGGTASYRGDGAHDIPPLVRLAVEHAERLEFLLCVRPEIGRLLATLAGGLPPGSRVGETGTGTGAGLAWMVSAADPMVHFVSHEIRPDRAAAAQEVFEHNSNVDVTCADGTDLVGRGPFDLLVLDGGPWSDKSSGADRVDPASVLRPGGTMTIDDFTPTSTWPPLFDGAPDRSRIRWLDHPDLRSTEIRVAPDLAVVVCRYLPG